MTSTGSKMHVIPGSALESLLDCPGWDVHGDCVTRIPDQPDEWCRACLVREKELPELLQFERDDLRRILLNLRAVITMALEEIDPKKSAG